jgi:pyruvate-ferredoxin/flavodoxin oxidoreductase
MLFANSVQEAGDFALIAQAATLASRVPFLHIFDGFRTSHEVDKIEKVPDEVIRAMIDDKLVHAHRARGLTPEAPVILGTAQNPDTYFQSRETVNPFYLAVPAIVQAEMDKFAALTGRQYQLYEYVGAPDAERVIVVMGSGGETAAETAGYLNERGEELGVLKVRLYRPFATDAFLAALPPTVKAIAVLDRTKEPGSAGEPLYLDVVTAIAEGLGQGRAPFSTMPRVINGRYGLASKEFTPAMVKAVFDELAKPAPKNHFTVGICDDVTHTSLDFDPTFDHAFEMAHPDVVRAVFWGLGADGTVSANKNSIKIIGEETDNYAQGYFVYDSKKSGARTISHLRFGPRPIHSPYLISRANFVAVHQFGFLQTYDVLNEAEPGAILLLNAPYKPSEVWEKLPRNVQETIIAKRLRVYTIDAYEVAAALGLGSRINTIMQTCFFAISGILPREEAIAQIKKSIRKSYGKRGEPVVQKNFAAVDGTIDRLYAVPVPAAPMIANGESRSVVSPLAPAFVQQVTAEMLAGRGDLLPVSALPADGTYPSATSQWEKRNIALEVPVWEPDLCIQCGKCVFVCPHSVIRAKVVAPEALADAPEGFLSSPARWREFPDQLYTLQVAVEDCTGCTLCVEACPAKDKSAVGRKAINMAPQLPLREEGRKFWEFFDSLPEPQYVVPDGEPVLKNNQIKNVQLLEPLFEFSGACAGCGETPYLKLISQLYGDRAYIANATGCSSIYGGNLPTTPWSVNDEGRGPAWSNSLFEDNAEFGLGMRLTLDKQAENAALLVTMLRPQIGDELADALLGNAQSSESQIAHQRHLVGQLKAKLAELAKTEYAAQAQELLSLAEMLVKKSVWIVGGDGWAYDIGYGGLDHVIASGRNVNILVMDTEVYSNTGGQSSKATPQAAVAKFAAAGKATPSKDLGMIAMSYGNVYVAHIAMGANDRQTLQAFLEAESYPGPSLIIAYSHCIAHGIDMAKGLEQQALAAQSGYWPLYRYDPRLKAEGKNPFQLDSKEPSIALKEYAYRENRYRILEQTNPAAAAQLMEAAQATVNERWKDYAEMAHSNGKK